MSATREIARREIAARGRTRAYRIGTVVVLLLAVAAVVIAAVVRGGDDDGPRRVTVGVVGLDEVVRELLAASPVFDVSLLDLDGSEVEGAVAEGDVDVAVVGSGAAGYEVVWGEDVDALLDSVIRSALAESEIRRRAADLGLSDADLGGLLAPLDAEERVLDESDSEADGARAVVGLVGSFLTFLAVQLYGQQLMMGVIEEKGSRIVEVLLSHVTARQLLTGKLLGIGLLALIQVVIVLSGLLGALLATDFVELPASAIGAIPLTLVTFVLGFAVYAAFLGALGSLVSRQEDAQSVILPALVPMMLGYFIGVSAVGGGGGVVADVAAIFPLTSPLVLPAVVAAGEAPPWLVATSLVLLAATTWLFLIVAGRVYEGTLLRTGSRVPWRDAIAIVSGRADGVEP